jgi:hypothetical protein
MGPLEVKALILLEVIKMSETKIIPLSKNPNGLHMAIHPECPWTTYFGSTMMKNWVVITEDSREVDSTVDTSITVHYWDEAKNDASEFILYWDDYLVPIQSLRIVKDIFELYNKSELSTFLELMKEMSTQYISASMQSQEKNRNELIERVKGKFLL